MPYPGEYGKWNVRVYAVTIFLCVILGIIIARLKELQVLFDYWMPAPIELFDLRTIAVLSLISAVVYINEKRGSLEGLLNKKARRALTLGVIGAFVLLFFLTVYH